MDPPWPLGPAFLRTAALMPCEVWRQHRKANAALAPARRFPPPYDWDTPNPEFASSSRRFWPSIPP